jgi:hypothetical protein
VPDEPARGEDTALSRERPSSGPSRSVDIGAVTLAIVGTIYTYAQLPPLRAFLATLAIALGLAGLLVVLGLLRRERRVAALSVGAGCAAGVAGLLVLLQTVPLDSSPANARPAPTATVTASPSSFQATSDPAPSKLGAMTSSVPASQSAMQPEQGTVLRADTKSFHKGALTVGAPNVYDWFADLTLHTVGAECSGNAEPGQSLVIVDQQDRWYRVTVLRLKENTSVSVEVSGGSGEAPSGQACYS